MRAGTWRFAINEDGVLRDVSDRKLILWGCGQYAKYIADKLQLEDIYKVVDTDEKKAGEYIVLYNRKYEIETISSMKTLFPRDHFILIGSNLYEAEIRTQVLNIWGGEVVPVCTDKSLFRVYSRIEDLLILDPVIQRKKFEGSVSVNLYDLIEKSKSIVSSHFNEGISGFYPIYEGHKLILVIIGRKRYVLQIPIHDFCVWRRSPRDLEVMEEVYHVIKRMQINEDMILYSDASGWQLEYYANEVMLPYDEETKEQILRDVRNIHISGQKISVEVNILERVKLCQENIEAKGNLPKYYFEIKDDFSRIVYPEILSWSNHKVIGHGDLHHGNVLIFNGQPKIIDWETLSMIDPMYDVCRFLYYCSIETDDDPYAQLDRWLPIYFGREPHKDEYIHAYAVMLYCDWIEYMLRGIQHTGKVEVISDRLIKEINKFKEVNR